MTLFWFLAAILIALALWFVVPPQLRDRSPKSTSRHEANLAVFRDKLAELEADKSRGTLSAENFELARQDLEREMLQDAVAATESRASMLAPLPRWTAPALTVGLPAAAVGLYLVLGGGPGVLERQSVAQTGAKVREALGSTGSHPQGQSLLSVEDATKRLAERLQREPDDVDGWLLLASSYRYLGREQEAVDATARAAALGKSPEPGVAPASPMSLNKSGDPDGDMAAVTEIVSARGRPEEIATASPKTADPSIRQLEERLARQPDDAEGWVMLGRSYQALNRFLDASTAYGKAVKLKSDDATLLADYGDALAAANGHWLPGEPMKWVEKALAIDPAHPKSLWLAATAAGQENDHARALEIWMRLQKVVPADSEDAAAIVANIDETRAAMGAAVSAKQTTPAGAPTGAADIAPAITLRGSVTVDPQLARTIGAEDTVFIFARAAQGPRMPLAVLRKQGKDLPTEFVLDDSMAVTPSSRLSDYPELIVGARVSKSGDAIAQPGDLEGLSGVVRPGDGAAIDIVIDKTRS